MDAGLLFDGAISEKKPVAVPMVEKSGEFSGQIAFRLITMW